MRTFHFYYDTSQRLIVISNRTSTPQGRMGTCGVFGPKSQCCLARFLSPFLVSRAYGTNVSNGPDSKMIPIDILVRFVCFVLQFLCYISMSVAWDLRSHEQGDHAIAPTLFFVELRSNVIQCDRTYSSPNEEENPSKLCFTVFLHSTFVQY